MPLLILTPEISFTLCFRSLRRQTLKNEGTEEGGHETSESSFISIKVQRRFSSHLDAISGHMLIKVFPSVSVYSARGGPSRLVWPRELGDMTGKDRGE